MKRTTIASVTAVLAMAGGVATAAPAGAATNNNQDGLVNVGIGDVNVLNDARVAVAANVVAEVCGVDVGPVAVLGSAVDRSGTTRTVCTTDKGPITISQN